MRADNQLIVLILFLFIPYYVNGQLITGKIIDRNGLPIPGAAVIVNKSFKLGTSADSSGSFSLDLLGYSKEPIVLKVMFIGYKTQTISLLNKSYSNVMVVLEEDWQSYMTDGDCWIVPSSYIAIKYNYIYPNTPLGFGLTYSKFVNYLSQIELSKSKLYTDFVFSFQKTYRVNNDCSTNTFGTLVNYKSKPDYTYYLLGLEINKYIRRFRVTVGLNYLDYKSNGHDCIYGFKVGVSKNIEGFSIHIKNDNFIKHNILTIRLSKDNIRFGNLHFGMGLEYNNAFKDNEIKLNFLYKFNI